MQTHLLVVGPISINGCGGGFSSSSSSIFTDIAALPWTSPHPHHQNHRRTHRRRWGPIASSSSSSSAIYGRNNHYEVLGVTRSATAADIKRAYRLLARKYHPDISKDAQAGEVFKSIRQAYEILSNQVTRIQYDRALKFKEHEGRPYGGKQNYSPEYDHSERIYYRWAEMRQKMRNEMYEERYGFDGQDSSSDRETDEEAEEANAELERGSFSGVLGSALLSLFLMQTFGSLLSLTVSSLLAYFDEKLDSGYKLGYFIAWLFGGRSGVLLTMCLSFTSWACGKTSSSFVVLVVVAMWVGSHLARYAPISQGAFLALLYVSMMLQADLK